MDTIFIWTFDKQNVKLLSAKSPFYTRINLILNLSLDTPIF